MSRIRRSTLFAAAALGALSLPAAPASAQDGPPPWLRVEDGISQPVFALADAIEETVYVEAPVDSDHDGARDRIRIRISRPGETASQGIDVPVVFEQSPYRGPTGEPANHPVDFGVLPQEFLRPAMATATATATATRMAVPRGRASARAGSRPADRPSRPARLAR